MMAQAPRWNDGVSSSAEAAPRRAFTRPAALPCAVVSAADELPHQPGNDRAWEESWYFDFVLPSGTLAGFARLTVRPAERRAWWWSAVVGPERPLVAVRDHDVPLPKGRTLEVRTSGLWAEPVCETPLEHWSVGLEAFAVAMDDPTDAYGSERGDPVPVGFDLEWEALTPPIASTGDQRYGQPCSIHGEVLVGQERVVVTARGAREHAWGPRQWWDGSWTWAAGTLDDGTPVGFDAEGEVELQVDVHGLLSGGRSHLGGVSVALEPLFHAPFQVPSDDGRTSRLARAACRLTADDGRRGWAWAERLQGLEWRCAPGLSDRPETPEGGVRASAVQASSAWA